MFVRTLAQSTIKSSTAKALESSIPVTSATTAIITWVGLTSVNMNYVHGETRLIFL